MSSPLGSGSQSHGRTLPGRGRALTSSRRKSLLGAAMVAPAASCIAVFFIAPLLYTVWMSLHRWPMLGTPKFVGAENYREIVHDDMFFKTLRFTFEYTIVLTPVLLSLGLLLALLVKGVRPGTRAFRTVYFLPVPLGFAATSYLWVWLVQPDVGPIGRLLEVIGVVDQPPFWLESSTSAMLLVTAMVIWKTAGIQMILLMAGLQSIPPELNEAAKLDGAGHIRLFTNVTLPLLRPTLALVMVFSVSGSLLAFEQFYIISKGGPRNSTMTAVYWIFHEAFYSGRLGYGAALSIVLLVLLVLVSVMQVKLINKSDDL